MPQTRSNAKTDQLEILHPETSIWAQAVALLQVVGGLDAKLAGTQGQQLAAIADGAAKLTAILDADQQTLVQFQLLASRLDMVVSELSNETNPYLSTLVQKSAGTEGWHTNVQARLDEIRAAFTGDTTGVLALLGVMNLKTVNYSDALNQLKDLLTQLVSLENETTPTIQVIPLTAADAEVTVALPVNTKILNFKVRKNSGGNSVDLRYAFANNQVNNPISGNYGTLDAYNQYQERIGKYIGSLYLSSSQVAANNVFSVEIESWT